MKENVERTSRWWTDFVAPVTVATVVSAVSGTIALFSTQNILGERIHNTELRMDRLEILVNEQGTLLRDIREDVSYVRGQIERSR